jgi:hypothetical protein
MEAMRSTWTDSHLDDLNGRVTHIGDDVRELRTEMRGEFADVRAEMREEFAAVGTEMREGFADVRGEFADLKRILIQLGGGLIGTLLVCMSGLIATQL